MTRILPWDASLHQSRGETQHVGVTVQLALTWVFAFTGLLAILISAVAWRRTGAVESRFARTTVPASWLLRGVALIAVAGSMAPLNDSAHWSDGLSAAQGLLWVVAGAAVIGVVVIQSRKPT